MSEKSPEQQLRIKKNEKDEKPTADEIKLKKLEDFVQKLCLAVENKEKYERNAHKEVSKQKVNNKSNYSSPTTSRIKEDTSDREFLSNLNMDERMTILPKNMHLLTDNDTNQSISPQEKFKNLSNLLIDDKNFTEFNFIRNSEERVKLNLYMAFSKKSRDLFIKEDDPKRAKIQTLFHKINDIHIPKFDFKPTFAPANNENKSGVDQSESNLEKSQGSDSNNTNSLNPNDKNINNGEDKANEEKKFKECYFRQEKKGYFHLPSLTKIEVKPPQRKEFRKQKTYLGPTKMYNPFKKENKKLDDNFWDPEIDADTLSYINHNFISIEDIYNSSGVEENKDKNNNTVHNDENEPNLVPIQAKEIFFDGEEILGNNCIFEKDRNNEMCEHPDYDKLKLDNKADNKFIEFIAINSGVIKADYPVSNNTKMEMKYEYNLKNDFREKINKISEIETNLFPRNGKLDAQKIERILRFQKLVKIKRKEVNFSLGVKNTTDESENKSNEMNNENEDDENDDKSKMKEKSISNFNENKNLIFEDDEFDGKNIISINSQNSHNFQGESGKKKVFNFNEGNSDHSPFSSEKS